MEIDKTNGNANLEWETRVLCEDESCIGVIGPNGRCKECGLKYSGQLPMPLSARSSFDLNRPAALWADDEQDVERDQSLDSVQAIDAEWLQRKLCRDENCIGVIGPNGRCKECGRPYDA